MQEQETQEDDVRYEGLESALLREYEEDKRELQSSNPSKLTERQYQEIMFQATLIQNARERDNTRELADAKNIRRIKKAANYRSKPCINHDQLYSRREDFGINDNKCIDLATRLVLGYRKPYKEKPYKEKKSLREKIYSISRFAKGFLSGYIISSLIFPTHVRNALRKDDELEEIRKEIKAGKENSSKLSDIWAYALGSLVNFLPAPAVGGNVLNHQVLNSLDPKIGTAYLLTTITTNSLSLAYEITRAVKKHRERKLREKLEMKTEE